jgi:hypothetical protein
VRKSATTKVAGIRFDIQLSPRFIYFGVIHKAIQCQRLRVIQELSPLIYYSNSKCG